MNQSLESHVPGHEHIEETPTATVALLAGILSSLFGLLAFSTNSLLLFTVYKDPHNHFRTRATTSFVVSLALSDFIGGSFVQPFYAAYMFCVTTGVEREKLYKISLISSHVSTKISILTVVALSVDRYLAVKLSWKYKALVTTRKVVVCNTIIWLFCGVFEASHSTLGSEELFHSVDLHLQTTVPLVSLCAVYAATYIEFRRHSRNDVFVRTENTESGRSRVFVRNISLEKKIVLTVVLIMVVLFISIVPYLIANNLEEQCHEEESNGVRGKIGFAITKALSVPLLCISCAVNPFLYAWRIPQYRQALRSVSHTACASFRRRTRAVSTISNGLPSALATPSLIEQNTPVANYTHKKQAES